MFEGKKALGELAAEEVLDVDAEEVQRLWLLLVVVME
jgi:hypothetical protein